MAGLLGRSTVFNREKAREILAPGWLCETEALRDDVGFTPEIPLAEGLARTAAWYRAEGWL
jgi:nucleoside-diphosphate-sugar epimerase